MYFKARFFYLLGRGMYDTLKHYWNQWLCENQGKLWSYFNERAEWNCTVCGDLSLFYQDTFTDLDCWNAYLRNPQKAANVIKLIRRLNWQMISRIDFSKQVSWSEQEWIDIFDNLANQTKQVRELLTGMTDYQNFYPPSPPPLLTPFTPQIIQAIINFLNNTIIETLSLGQHTIGNEGVAVLAQMLSYFNIKKLYLDANNIGDEGIANLTEALSKVEQLQTLDLSYNNIGDKGISILAPHLRDFNIQTINFMSNHIGVIGIKALVQALPDTILQMNLGGNNIGDDGVKALAPFLNQSSMQELSLWDNSISDEGIKTLSLYLNASCLQSLNLQQNHISHEGIEVLAQYLNGSTLYQLYLWNNSIGDKGATALAKHLWESKLNSLELVRNGIGDIGVAALAHALLLSKAALQTLILTSNRFGDAGTKALAQALSNSTLQFLDLGDNTIGDEGMKILAQHLVESAVKTLYIWGTKIDSARIMALAPYLARSAVQTLDLGTNNIGDEGMKVLARYLNGSHLQYLYLNNNHIGVDGAFALAQYINSSALQFLDLWANKIGNAGIKSLALALPKSHVQRLRLQSNDIGDEGAIVLAKALITASGDFDLSAFLTPDARKALVHANPATPLNYLGLSNNNISNLGAKALCRVLPATYISVSNLDLYGNPINQQQVDIATCYISEANSLQPSGPFAALYRVCQTTLRYVVDGYHQITDQWRETSPVSLSPAHNKAQKQFSSSIDSMPTVEKVSFDSPDFLPGEITINESPVISNALFKKNKKEPLFTFKVTPAILAEPATTTASSRLSKPTNHPSKSPFSFFNGLANNPSVTTQLLNSSLPALPKPVETLPTANTLGAIGAAVTGLLAVGCWLWKNCKRSSNVIPISEKRAHSQPKIKTPKLLP
jgi:Ran GTPase-activating protein (RanGAP) involved in mRNA processing and transport